MAAEVSGINRRRRQRGLASSTGMTATTADGLEIHHKEYSVQHQQPRESRHHQLINNASQGKMDAFSTAAL